MSNWVVMLASTILQSAIQLLWLSSMLLVSHTVLLCAVWIRSQAVSTTPQPYQNNPVITPSQHNPQSSTVPSQLNPQSAVIQPSGLNKPQSAMMQPSQLNNPQSAVIQPSQLNDPQSAMLQPSQLDNPQSTVIQASQVPTHSQLWCKQLHSLTSLLSSLTYSQARLLSLTLSWLCKAPNLQPNPFHRWTIYLGLQVHLSNLQLLPLVATHGSLWNNTVDPKATRWISGKLSCKRPSCVIISPPPNPAS